MVLAVRGVLEIGHLLAADSQVIGGDLAVEVQVAVAQVVAGKVTTKVD